MPKTYKNLYLQVYDFDNLYRAHRKACKGGKRKRREVAEEVRFAQGGSATRPPITDRLGAGIGFL